MKPTVLSPIAERSSTLSAGRTADGLETCRRMRRTSWGAQARILALSGCGQPNDRERSMQAGFDEHLVKLVDRETLRKALVDQGPRTH